MPPLISAESLSRHYIRGKQLVRALDSVSFSVEQGEFLAIIGPSGSGKTTLLNLLGCMDSPTSGRLVVAGQDITHATESQKVEFRRQNVGFVFQHFGLVPTLSVEENITLPSAFWHSRDHHNICDLVERFGLAPRRHHRPSELSGGEMQRVAIARALYNKPKVLLADEPTGNLDRTTGETIMSLFLELNQNGLTIVLVTHNEQLASSTDRQIALMDGRVIADLEPPKSDAPYAQSRAEQD